MNSFSLLMLLYSNYSYSAVGIAYSLRRMVLTMGAAGVYRQSMIGLQVTQAFAPMCGTPLGANAVRTAVSAVTGVPRAVTRRSSRSTNPFWTMSRKREIAVAAAIGTLLAFSLILGGEVHAEGYGGQKQMGTYNDVSLLASASNEKEEESQELLPGTEPIPPEPNSFLLCRGPSDILAGRNKCNEIAYPLLALPLLNGAVFLGLLALKKFQDQQEEPPSKK